MMVCPCHFFALFRGATVFFAWALVAVALSGPVPSSAASLLPGEALCGVGCETITLPPQLGESPTTADPALLPPRIIGDPEGAFLGDYTTDGPPLFHEELQREDDAPSEGDDNVPVPR